jgi:glycosyltransferase involved in cell wall biosynthesis
MKFNHKTPAVSVIMPVYNGEPYLREAIHSILSQTFDDFEFIIIDDGSIDSTWEILNDYVKADDRIVLRRNLENLGLVKTLNKGFALARGKYIARQDADDISLPKRLEKQVTFLEDNPEVGLLGSAYYRLDSQGQRSIRQPPLSDTAIRWKMLFGNRWCHASVMFRLKLFESGEAFYKDYLHAEDYELWTRLLRRTQAATLADALVIYRVHESSICKTHHEAQSRMVVSISAREISNILPQRSFTFTEIESLQRCNARGVLGKKDLIMCRKMFELFNAFKRQPGIDPGVVRRLRREWIKRRLAVASVGQLRDFWTSGFLPSIFQDNPLALLVCLLVYFPQRTVRRFGQRFFLQKHSIAKKNIS